jgi:hypothetical protein
LIKPLVALVAGKNDSTVRNPPAVFILSPPRSGTTLLAAMLAGHPRLFAASELHQLGFNTLAERRTAFSRKYSLWLEGTIRLLMEIYYGTDAATAATSIPALTRRSAAFGSGVEVTEIAEDKSAPRLVYDPSHPDANERFPDTWLGHYAPTAKDMPVLFGAGLLYKLLIPGSFLFFGTYIALDARKRWAAHRTMTLKALEE